MSYTHLLVDAFELGITVFARYEWVVSWLSMVHLAQCSALNLELNIMLLSTQPCIYRQTLSEHHLRILPEWSLSSDKLRLWLRASRPQ